MISTSILAEVAGKDMSTKTFKWVLGEFQVGGYKKGSIFVQK